MNCKTTPPSVSLKSLCSVYFSRVQAELQPGVSLTCCRCMYQPQLPRSLSGLMMWWGVCQTDPSGPARLFQSELSPQLIAGACVVGVQGLLLLLPQGSHSSALLCPVAEWWRFNPWKTRFQIALQLCFILDHDALLQVSAVLPLAGELCLLLRAWAVSARGDCSHVPSDLFQMALQRELSALQAGRGSSGSKRAQAASGDSGEWFPYLLYYPFS